MGSVEARVRELEDRDQLRDLPVKYALAIDDRDFQGLGRLFTEDARIKGYFRESAIEMLDRVAGGQDPTDLGGRDAIVAAITAVVEGYGATYHYVHSQLITSIEAEMARGIVSCHAELAAGGVAYQVALRYYDSYLRSESGWRFSAREMHSLYCVPIADLATELTREGRTWTRGLVEGVD